MTLTQGFQKRKTCTESGWTIFYNFLLQPLPEVCIWYAYLAFSIAMHVLWDLFTSEN